jgi:HD-GYP domain-containing protein (c-di-GMP phosphodiesterase class II)
MENFNEKVLDLSAKLGRAAGLDQKQIDNLLLLARIRDLGMITVPADLLNKEEKLTGPELETIYRHTERAYQVASDSVKWSKVAELLHYCHERYDGSGYPRGLKGEEIPIEWRILAIAKAYSVEKAVDIEDPKFDPVLVEKVKEIINAGA